MNPSPPSQQPDLRPARTLRDGLLRLRALKRMRGARDPSQSLASRFFKGAWVELIDHARVPEQWSAIAARWVVRAMVAERLGELDARTLRAHGQPRAVVAEVLSRILDDWPLQPHVRAQLERASAVVLDESRDWVGPQISRQAPEWAHALSAQPRAGVTHPAHGRLVLPPYENHAEHCFAVALYGWLLAAFVPGADPVDAFLAGMVHHLQHASLFDIGWAGDVFLGEQVVDQITRQARQTHLVTLDGELGVRCEGLLELIGREDTPTAQAFHIADALDRHVEIMWHEQRAGFTMAQALGPYELIHPGLAHALQVRALRELELEVPHDS